MIGSSCFGHQQVGLTSTFNGYIGAYRISWDVINGGDDRYHSDAGSRTIDLDSRRAGGRSCWLERFEKAET